MDGLNDLVAAVGQSPEHINNLVIVLNFQDELEAARAIRNRFSAHLEIDEAYSLESLLIDFDSYNLDRGLSFYERTHAAFVKTCRSVLFLRVYAIDGKRLYGVSASRQLAVPYSSDSTEQHFFSESLALDNDDDSEATYQQQLTCWFDGDEHRKGDAYEFFFRAFLDSKIVEDIEENVQGTSLRHHGFRKVHQFIASILNAELSDSDYTHVLELILQCRGGAPYALAEVLIRQPFHSMFRQWLTCHVLGELGSAPHASVDLFLDGCARSPSWGVRLRAVVAKFKIFIKNEGLFRVNNRGKIQKDYKVLVDSLVGGALNNNERTAYSVAFASVLAAPNTGAFAQPFGSEYGELQGSLEKECAFCVLRTMICQRLQPRRGCSSHMTMLGYAFT